MLALVVLGALIFFTDIRDFGGGSQDVDIDVNLPKVDAPAPAAPAPPRRYRLQGADKKEAPLRS